MARPRFSSMLVAITLNFSPTLCQHAMRCLLPINMDRFTIFLSTNSNGRPTGGVLIKEAGLDVLLLSLPHSHVSQRSPSADKEDKFCNLMRRTGATCWTSKQDWFDVQVGLREITEEEKVMVYG
ncbi:hypothetical protein BDV41DRAFT_539372 [Aspergillus transmontanensis]|uniref:Pyridoxamine 5'-phosphate oxidase putative domain-containing protein n=1 Tax=Aspergillus transmontanensis TaxID=1034304 RepID=A0A5N6VV03_9EURO|nr:hypothetical protein BDV41DRAFT_539372 [Aspergillus transmontanensis]